MAEHRIEMEMSRAAAPCRIWIPQPNSTRGATSHAGYYHRFSLFKPVSRSYHTAPTPSDNGSDDVDDRTRDDAGHCALGWPRWQLPDGTTISSCKFIPTVSPLLIPIASCNILL